MIGIVLIVVMALLVCGYLTFRWWRAGPKGSDMVAGSLDQQTRVNPNRTKAINARQGITIEGETWNKP